MHGVKDGVNLSAETLAHLTGVFARYLELAEVRLFGSRATGSATSRSDIDLATIGISERSRLGELMLDLDDLPIAQICDVVDYGGIENPRLRRHIDNVGVTIWRRPNPQPDRSVSGQGTPEPARSSPWMK